MRGPQVFAGYAGRPPRSPEEWFPTGDLAARDPATGAITITGRSKDLIISGGMNVHPREVEDVLARHAAVDSVAVVGVPSVRWGEEVTAFVVSTHGFEADDLRRWTRERLSAFKVPKRFHHIEAIPRNAIGKIMRNELVERGARPTVQARTRMTPRHRRLLSNGRRTQTDPLDPGFRPRIGVRGRLPDRGPGHAFAGMTYEGSRHSPCDRHVPEPLTSIGTNRGLVGGVDSPRGSPGSTAVNPKGEDHADHPATNRPLPAHPPTSGPGHGGPAGRRGLRR